VLPASEVQLRSHDTERPYAPDRELYYLTGVTRPGALAVITGEPEPRFVLFVPERDPEAELWGGPVPGPEEAQEAYRPDECHPASALDDELPKLLRGVDRLFFRLGRGGAGERHVLAALAWARSRGARRGNGPRAVVDPGEILDELRLVKDSSEIERLRRAAAITVEGHRAGAAAIAPGVGEWAVEAAIEAAFRGEGAEGPGFETIVGAGSNACVLHYVANRGCVGPGDLVLVDAGAEWGLYHGDVTRTYPSSGRFTPEQRDVYDVVERAREAGVAAARPGATVADVHDAAVRAIVGGLVELGALAGAVEDLVEAEEHKRFFPHQTSHWLGLDVHDPGDYARDGRPRRLEVGMVLTVEPGVYFGKGIDGVPPDLAGIGIRIEDDVLVTEAGAEILGVGLPTAADEIEALLGVGR